MKFFKYAMLSAIYGIAILTSFIIGESYTVDLKSIIRENERQKTLIAWVCNDLPTHEACEGYQREVRNR